MYRTVAYELLSLEAWLLAGKRPNRALHAKIRTETLRIRDALLTGVISLTEDTHVCRYVRTHHFGVIQLLNKLHQKQSLESHATLMELLNLIESNFSPYLEPDAELCNSHRAELNEHCRQMIAALNKAFEKSGGSKELLFTYHNAFRGLSNGRTTTYRQRLYAQSIMLELKELLSTGVAEDFEEILATLLLSLDINTSSALRYWETRISTQINSAELKSAKRDRLIAFQRSLSQISNITGRYNPHAPPLHEQIWNDVAEEIDRLERPNLTPTHRTADAMPETFRVRTELSVSQLACFVKTLVDTRIIVNPNVSELLRFCAQTMVSKRAEDISFDSLRAKYYNIESGTKEALRQTLQNLMKKLA